MLNDAVVNRLQLFMAVAGMALLAYGYFLADKGRPREHQKARDAILLVLGVFGALAYSNFLNAHWSNFIHIWDTYHYYVGAKYFPELGYERLYDCTNIADAEDLGRARVERRVITDLRTNQMVPVAPILDDPNACKSHFTPERWAAFKRDIDFFRSRVDNGKWENILKDHGYNATPVWNALGRVLANSGPATQGQVTFLCWLDPLFLIAAALAILWAFGWRVACVAALFFGTDIPGRYLWTGGAFLRHDWLFWMVLSVCALKKHRPALGGAAIAYSALLRLFPGLLIAGPVLAFIEKYRTTRRFDRELLRYFAGGIAATVVLLGISFALSGGPSSWPAFARNSQKHASTPLTNHMGLRTVVSYRPSTIGARMVNGKATDPWGAWKQARLDNFHQLLPLFAALCLGFLALLYFAVRNNGCEPWLAAALGSGLIAIGAELTCYYYCFIVVLTLAWAKRREVGILILLMNAVWLVTDWAPFSWMSPNLDEKYTFESLWCVLTVGAIYWGFTQWGVRYALLPEPGLQPTEPAPVPLAVNAPVTIPNQSVGKKKRRKKG